jgi:hypothetical protein
MMTPEHEPARQAFEVIAVIHYKIRYPYPSRTNELTRMGRQENPLLAKRHWTCLAAAGMLAFSRLYDCDDGIYAPPPAAVCI